MCSHGDKLMFMFENLNFYFFEKKKKKLEQKIKVVGHVYWSTLRTKLHPP